MSARGFAESSTATRNGSELNANINGGGGGAIFSTTEALLKLSVEEKAGTTTRCKIVYLCLDVNLLDVRTLHQRRIFGCVL